MIVISDIDRYISTTWGASIRLEAGVPKEVGQDIGIFCLQEGCTEHKPNDIKNKKIGSPIKEETISEGVIVELTESFQEVTTSVKEPVKPTPKKKKAKK
jgi:hypothetical protein